MKRHRNYSLLNFNTFHIPSVAEELIIIENESEYEQVLEIISNSTVKTLILGSGSNILFTSDFRVKVIKINISDLSVHDKNDEFTWIRATAGINWHTFVVNTIEMGLYGLENLSLIPGTVGASPVQNIGAYGVELDQFIDSVQCCNILSGEEFNLNKSDCKFSYRSSIFKNEMQGKMMIKSVIYKLKNTPEYNISYGDVQKTLLDMGAKKYNARDISNAIIRIRSEKLPDPTKIGNAGSFFKNPELDETALNLLKLSFPAIPFYSTGKNYKIPAAWLIEECGWKGRRLKNVGTHPKQPLVLVNYGGATGKEILELSNAIQESVFAKFNLKLIPEVNII
jgi:UDP-N-acetylmuramate dehydrogenase